MKQLILACVVLLPLTACSVHDAGAVTSTNIETLGIKNTMMVERGLASSGQPSEDQFARLPGAGIRTVICLRAADEPDTGWEEAKAAEIGVDFVRIPVTGADAVNESNARALDETLAASAGGGTLVCCASGNRVGGLLAMRAFFVQGKTPEEALAYGKRGGLTEAEPVVREKLGLPKQN